MNTRLDPKINKIVLVVQDLTTKDKETVAVVSGDIHYHTSESKDQISSFQMLLGDHPEFARQIKTLSAEAIKLKEEKK